MRAERRAEFERHYAPDGTWARLFGRDPAYRGTALGRDVDEPLRHVTVDAWGSLAAFRAFRERHAAEYAALDRECDALTTDERCLGVFEDA